MTGVCPFGIHLSGDQFCGDLFSCSGGEVQGKSQSAYRDCLHRFIRSGRESSRDWRFAYGGLFLSCYG